jgi:Ran GTPase-activating protein (RanGAP) involved in mRNA processing and transport
MAESRDYDALAQDILEDITSSEKNADILRMLRDGDPNWSKKLFIVNEENDDGLMNDFVVREGDDFGWLGYFIGKSEVVEELYIHNLPEAGDGINSFFEGMSQNRSLKDLYIRDDIGVDGWSRLGSFFENNRNLLDLELEEFTIGQESAQYIASAFERMKYNSLKYLSMNGTNISDEGVTHIVTALRSQPWLENLSFGGNNIGRSGCISLGNTLSNWSASNKLKTLSLDNNAIDDGGLQALVSGMMNCCSLNRLNLSYNQSITADGLRSLSPLLQSKRHSLETLLLYGINYFGDDGAVSLAEGLRGNKSLKELLLSPSTAGITAVGWSAFSKLLCDTSTINTTYLSNHTLTTMGCYDNRDTPEDIHWWLATNTYEQAAICKILRSHPDLDMEPFFKLKMQFLPAVMSWFERVEPIEDELIEDELIDESERSCQSRKLSALYKFVRAMPDLTIIGYWEGRMIHIEAKKRRLVDEMLRIADERRRLEYEEKVTLERLGDRPMNEDEVNRSKRMRHE